MSESEKEDDAQQREELDATVLASNLVPHLRVMGAAGGEIPVEHNGRRYTVTVKVES